MKALLVLLGVLFGSQSALAESMIQIIPAQVAGGAQFSWGACPCFRWSIQIQAAGGGVETREFLISSEALFKFRDETTPDFVREQNHLFTVGAIETLWKKGHVGVGFRGVSFGDDRDRGYSEILRSGIYAVINLILKDAMRLDIRSAYDFEQMRINYGENLVTRVTWDQSAAMRWHTGSWSGQVNAHIGFDNGRYLAASSPRWGAATAVRARFLQWEDLAMGLSLQASYENDPLRELVGLYPWNAVGALVMDVSYVANADEAPNVLR